MTIAALEYEAALAEICREAVNERLSPKDERGRSFIGVPENVIRRLYDLRKAAVREYEKALEDDEKQRIAQAVKGW